MKFGKRLAAEASRCWPEACLDYKAIKRALKADLQNKDPAAESFLKQLLAELTKVSSFYVEQAQMLEDVLAQQMSCSSPDEQQLSKLRSQIRQLIKFVALNYLAVVKAIKKRNRHCKAVFGEAAAGPDIHPMDLLRQEVFFTSPRLAALSTQAELLAASVLAATSSSTIDTTATTAAAGVPASPSAAAAAAAAAAAGAPANLKAAAAAAAASAAVEVEDYQCPICLDVLRSPVVLNCTHRFCWGCLVGHCVAVTQGPSSHHPSSDSNGNSPTAAAAAAGGACSSNPSSCGNDCGTGGNTTSSCSSKGLVVLEKLVAAGDSSSSRTAGDSSSSTGSSSDYYSCPVCRQPQVLSIDNLQVDPHLSVFVDGLRATMKAQGSSSNNNNSIATVSVPSSEQSAPPSVASSISTETEATASLSRCSSVASELARSSAAAVVQQPEVEEVEEEEDWSQYLLPRQLPCHAGRLTVLLDLDGTLVSSFTPRRAPVLPPSMKTHLVGVGSSLNPGGVFVVERPGLTPFLQQLAAMSEVVVFTAGLEEYAAPIIDAIDPTGRLISGRLYRPACKKTPHHQCVKDLIALGRPLSRTVLVDDTPLAFLHQPENGVPVLGFRGDPDDRLLLEAVLPLIQTVAGAPDVRPVLTRRFDMLNWFKRHGYPDSLWQQQPQQQQLVRQAASTTARAASVPHPSSPEAARGAPAAAAADLRVVIDDVVDATQPPLIVMDFDKTVSAWDAGERIVSELAPELLPWLQGLESPANFIPVTCEVMAEMARRGVSRDKLLSQLQALGSEIPAPMVQLLQWAKQEGFPVKVLSDCNSVFINNILAGARLSSCVDEVITNAAGFERLQGSGADAAVGLGSSSAAGSNTSTSSSFKLVIQPRQPQSHNCPLCPSNLCKGAEMAQLLQQQRKAAVGGAPAVAAAAASRGRVVYAGDGANDICPALALGPDDVVLAKAGHALARYAVAAAADSSLQQIAARVCVWDTHEQLAQLVRQHVARPDGKCSA